MEHLLHQYYPGPAPLPPHNPTQSSSGAGPPWKIQLRFTYICIAKETRNGSHPAKGLRVLEGKCGNSHSPVPQGHKHLILMVEDLWNSLHQGSSAQTTELLFNGVLQTGGGGGPVQGYMVWRSRGGQTFSFWLVAHEAHMRLGVIWHQTSWSTIHPNFPRKILPLGGGQREGKRQDPFLILRTSQGEMLQKPAQGSPSGSPWRS